MPIILALLRWKQEDCECKASLGHISKFQASLSYVIQPCFKKKKKDTKEQRKDLLVLWYKIWL